MSQRTLMVLTVLLVLLGSWVGLRNRASETRRDADLRMGSVILPDLDLSKVTAVEIVTPTQTNRLAQAEKGWVVASAQNYPADLPRLTQEMRRLAELKVGDRIRGAEASLREFGLAPGSPDDTAPTTVRFLGTGDAELAQITLGGERRTGDPQQGGYPDGAYVRVGEGPVILVGETLSGMPRQAEDWMPRQLTDIRERVVQSMRIARGDRMLDMTRGEGGWAIDALDAEKEFPQQAKIGSLARGLEYLRFTKLADQGLDDAATGMDDPVTISYRFANGVMVEVKVGGTAPDSTDRYLRLSTHAEPMEPAEKAEGESEEAEGENAAEPAEPEGPAIADLEKVSGWLYQVASFSADTFRATREELVGTVQMMATTPETGEPAGEAEKPAEGTVDE